MAIKRHTGIQVKLTDIIEPFQLEKERSIFSFHRPRKPAKEWGGKFLQFDMPDSTTILTSHN